MNTGARAGSTRRWLASVMVPLVVVAGGCATTSSSLFHDRGAKTVNEGTNFEREMNTGMTLMMRDMHAPGYSGNADVDFLAMMIPHHAGAVDMARLVLQHGRDPATRQLAEEIIAGQTIEIEGMTRRLAALRQLPGREASEFPALGGTRGPSVPAGRRTSP